MGGLLSETLAMRGVRVVVLDVRKGEWEGEVGGQSCLLISFEQDSALTFGLVLAVNNIAWYRCDVSKKAEVDACAKRIRKEVSFCVLYLHTLRLS